MNIMNYDALNLGTGEFLYGNKLLSQIDELAEFPMLNANINWGKGKKWSRSYLIKEAGGIKIGIVGVVLPGPVKKAGLKKVSVKEPIEVLPPLISLLDKKVDLIVVLCHLGFEASKALAVKIEGIDVLISAHNRKLTSKPVRIGTTIIMQASNRGKYLGVLTLKIDKKDCGIIEADGRIVLLDNLVKEDRAVARLVSRHTKKVDEAKKADKRREASDQKKIMKTLKEMTPEEYIESLKQSSRPPVLKNSDSQENPTP